MFAAVMRAVMHEEIPSIGNERARKESAAGYKIGQREANPYLPKNCEDRFIRVGMMQPMFPWRKIVQNKAMDRVFGKRPRNYTAYENRSGGAYFEWRDHEQNDRENGHNQHFAEMDDGRHEPTLSASGAADTGANGLLGSVSGFWSMARYRPVFRRHRSRHRCPSQLGS
jgi:hypothetical protein